MQREACLPKQPWVSISTYTSFLYLSFQYYRLHSTLFRDIDESLLYSTDSDEEDPFFLMLPSAVEANERGSGGQRLMADLLLSLAAVGGGSRGRCIDQGHKTPFSSPPKKSIGPQKKSTPVSWAAPSLKSADTCSKGRPQLSKQR